MDFKEAIEQVLVKSLANAEQWYRDGLLLIQNESQVHGCVLLDFAGEEIAKAYACWLVLIGAIPTNHPLVKPNKKVTIDSLMREMEKEDKRVRARLSRGKSPGKNISVFSSHEIKDSLLVGLGSLMLNLTSLAQQEPPRPLSMDAYKKIASLNLLLGKIGAWKRMRWIYANMEYSGQGYEVSNPLEEELGNLGDKMAWTRYELEFMKKLASFPYTDFGDLAEEFRKQVAEEDPFWPKGFTRRQ